jgi:GAF domain-containing protein
VTKLVGGMLRLLLVTTCRELRESIVAFLEKNPHYQVDTAASGAAALHYAARTEAEYDVAVVDDALDSHPGGFEVVRELKHRYPDIEIVILTRADSGRGLEAIEAGADRFISKPVDFEELDLTLQFADRERQARSIQKSILSTNIITSDELKKMFAGICSTAVKTFEVDYSGLVRFDSERSDGLLVARYPQEEWFGSKPIDSVVIPVTGVLAEERVFYGQKTINIPNVADPANKQDLGPVQDILLDAGIQSILIVPVVVENEVVASFSLDSTSRRREFSEREVALCERLARQVARIIRTHLFQFQEVRKERQHLGQLYEAINTIIRTHDPSSAAQSIADTLRKVMNAWHAETLLADESEPQWQIAESRAEAEERFHRRDWIASKVREEGVSQQVLRRKIARYIPDADAEADSLNPRMLERGVKAAVCLPLALADSSIGVLWVHFKEKRAFPESERQALEIYANQAAAAYEYAQRIQAFQNLSKAAHSLLAVSNTRDAIDEMLAHAKTLLGARYAVYWAYDQSTDTATYYESDSGIVSPQLRECFELETDKPGGMPRSILQKKNLEVSDLSDSEAEFLGPELKKHLQAIGIGSFVGVRLEIEKEVLGMLFAGFPQAREFSDDERRTLGTFATLAALALNKARLPDQLRKATATATAVAQVSPLAQDIGKLVVEQTRAELGSDAVVLYRYDQATERLGYPPVMSGVRYEAGVMTSRTVPGESIVWDVLNRLEPIYIEDASSHPFVQGRKSGKKEGFVKREEVKALVAVPIRAGDWKLGALFINYREDNDRKGQIFGDEYRAKLKLFIAKITVAMRNAQLQEGEGPALSYLRHGTADFRFMLQQLAEQALRVVGAESALEGAFSSVSLLEGSKLQVVAASSFEMLDTLRKETRNIDIYKSRPIGISGRAASRGITQNVANVEDDPDYIKVTPGIKFQLSVPIIVTKDDNRRIIGVISIELPEDSRDEPFSSADEFNVEILAQRAAVAIETAQVLNVKGSLARMGLAGSVWWHGIEGDALGIRNTTLALREELDSHYPELVANKSIELRLSRIETLASDILDKPTAIPSTEEDSVSIVSVNEIINERVRQLWQREPYNLVRPNLQLGLDEATQVRANADWLRRVFDILINNAVESMEHSRRRVLTISTGRAANSGVEIIFTDTGMGIPDEKKVKLFTQPVEEPSRTKGFGMGLLIAQDIIQAYGGNIRLVESKVGQGTTIAVWLPRPI